MGISARNQHLKALQREILHGKVQKREFLCSGGILKKLYLAYPGLILKNVGRFSLYLYGKP